MFQLFDERRGKRYPLTGLIKEIGRTSDCDLCIPDDERMSRLHARLDWDGTDWIVVDLGSTNGIFVNGEKVAERKLRAGDVLEVGDTHLRYLPLPVEDKGARKKTTKITQSPAELQSRRKVDITQEFITEKEKPDKEGK